MNRRHLMRLLFAGSVAAVPVAGYAADDRDKKTPPADGELGWKGGTPLAGWASFEFTGARRLYSFQTSDGWKVYDCNDLA